MFDWSLVSEPGKMGSQMFELFRFPDFRCWGNTFEKYGFEISKKNHKGVMGRPWTKQRVLRVIPSTLKFQFIVKC